MKSAREWADELWCDLPSSAQDAMDYEAWIDGTASVLSAHACRWSLACADRVSDCYDREFGRVSPIVAAAPAPGEET